MKNQRGFSLIELLVVMAVLSTTLLVITDIFVNVTQSQQRSIAWLKAQSEMRYAMEFMTQAVRTNKIYYADAVYSDGMHSPDDTLAFQGTFFTRATTDCPGNVGGCIVYGTAAVSEVPVGTPLGCAAPGEYCTLTGQTRLTGNQVTITRLDFYITPTADPFAYDTVTKEYKADQQPQVTIVLEGESVGPNELDRKKIHMQTTVSTRSYAR